ncbi:similar to protein tyrosine phosphatase, receptor type, C polypeptide-associated protein, isoform CRA_b [Rattus norvegicus]|uniref:Protein tyrosine phosphatase receptor type C-associated protein n=2 Tax=Rattus norvegicus TaxID=10116 RepID=F7FP40_RAT|nr:protein tyrosine phosphatase receptor type C-associated protein precursor [Rattus norvegicus]AAH88279.1 Protein tyrosine phosphatase, receptor type, C-associated protein [Rattus norvegicus]EDM12378.1 similar to protein tyrosine phosphatase, receptor type, C polypeptide-associated protein, isoform CRA_b [Rattus norvegicus]|eukprot:NP_001019460.1 protein tyrosine phosphatase receptor type C-associated protein precursor [Rattus norvegicus]
MALPGTLGFGVLLALPGALASGSGPDDGAGSNVVTIVLLLLLLLLLVTGLALAWRRLSHASGGYYHPARLGAMLWGRTCRLLWASPAGRWLRARTELGSPEEPEPQEDEQDAEDFMMDGGPEGADAKEEEQRCEAQQTPDVHDTDSEGGLGLSSQGPVGSGSSAEALLSDLHAFSGSAAWDDSAGRARDQGLRVTAL